MKKISSLELKKMRAVLKDLPKEIKIPKLETNLKIPKAVGCKDCNFSGYRERTGIFEAFSIDDEMEKFILTSPSIASVKEKALKKKMVPMYQDGLIKVLEGTTTIEEVERVFGQ